MANGNLDLRLRIRADSKELVGALSRAQSGLRVLAWAGACCGRSLVRRGGRGRFEAGGGA